MRIADIKKMIDLIVQFSNPSAIDVQRAADKIIEAANKKINPKGIDTPSA